MDNTFDQAFKWLIEEEGGYVFNPKDPGGETKYGISKRAYPDLDIKNLTLEQAKDIYYKDYWKRCKCDQLPYPLDYCVLDFAVNAGKRRAIKYLQLSVNILIRKYQELKQFIKPLKVDGIIGQKTINTINEIYESGYLQKLVTEYIWLRALYYAKLGRRTPLNTFVYGWLRRVKRVHDRIMK